MVQANVGMVELYWNIGNEILRRQQNEGWGARVIDLLSKDIKDALPGTGGFSPKNLKYMRKFAELWPDSQFVQQPVAQLPWRSNILLMDRLPDEQDRLWYAQKAVENGWSSAILDM